jgi:hypothetical protein
VQEVLQQLEKERPREVLVVLGVDVKPLRARATAMLIAADTALLVPIVTA